MRLRFVVLARMTVTHATRRLVHSFDVMNVANVRFHVSTTRGEVVRRELLLSCCHRELCVKTVLDSGRQQIQHGLHPSRLERFVARRNGRSQVTPGGLETRVRLTFTCTVQADER